MEQSQQTPKNKGGRPRKPVDIAAALASPEGQAAISAAAEAAATKMAEKMAEQFQAKAGAVGPQATGDVMRALEAIFGQMGMSFAAIADQGTGRIRISPEEQAKRDAAKERMGSLLMQAFESHRQAKFRGDGAEMDRWMPVYEVRVPTHMADRLVQPFTDEDGIATPTVIEWQGPPGPALKPVNEIATLIFEQYSLWIGGIPDTINGAAAQPQWVTLGRSNGLTVKTTPHARFRDGVGGGGRRQISALADTGEIRGPESGPAFAIRRRGENLQPQTRHVLGTVVPPARDMVPGEARRA